MNGNSFQSTPSVWRETGGSVLLFMAVVFQSTPSVWRETQGRNHPRSCCHISIHSLRMEGDFTLRIRQIGFYISIHSLRMEGDFLCAFFSTANGAFQSTPSVWRETDTVSKYSYFEEFQSTPSVWRETRLYTALSYLLRAFQSTPSVWRETLSKHSSCGVSTFQSTPSVWRETSSVRKIIFRRCHFNPLPPYGGRLSSLRSMRSS